MIMINNIDRFPSFSEFLQNKKFKRISGNLIVESERVLIEFEKEFPRYIVRADPSKRILEVTTENMMKIFKILLKLP